MLSVSCTSIDVEPKICADHFLLMESRSFRPRTTTGMSSESEAGSMRERKVWLPILASTPCVCFWFVGSASAVTSSCESFLISGLATMAPISRRTAPVALRISARTSSAASARRGTISGKQVANCEGAVSAICRRHGAKTSIQLAFTFQRLSSMPARSAGTTTAATPWPRGCTESTIAHAAFVAGPPSLLSAKSATSFSRRGRTKGVAEARFASCSMACALAVAASFPEPAKAASMPSIIAASAFSTFTAAVAVALLSAAVFLSALA
mmetsp:Transcript_30116/g.86729  ORF Transcript_30116/g.86729 Transcript_30116/m.86729 type:complete len:267 (-) Transcript_30116:113-913(-)